MTHLTAPLPGQRDPAWAGRVFWLLAAAVVLWPLLVLAEFKPWVLISPESLKPTARFLADFLPGHGPFDAEAAVGAAPLEFEHRPHRQEFLRAEVTAVPDGEMGPVGGVAEHLHAAPDACDPTLAGCGPMQEACVGASTRF